MKASWSATFVCTAVLCCCAAWPPGGQDVRTIQVSDRVLVLQMGPWADTMTVLDAGDSLVVVDTYSSQVMAGRAKTEIDAVFGKPVSHVINTHYHWDHTFGNQVFEGAVIVGHRLCREDMETEYGDLAGRLAAVKSIVDGSDPSSDLHKHLSGVYEQLQEGHRLVLPNRLVDDRLELSVGDLTLRLLHAPGLHRRSNLTIHVPELGLVFTRRSFHHTRLPRLEEGVDLEKLIAGFEEIAGDAHPVQYIIPGHGSPLPEPKLSVALGYLKELQRAVLAASQQKAGSVTDAAAIFDSKKIVIPEAAQGAHSTNLQVVWAELQAAER
jgi:glyoxylase-like metal-dependent hydrolase (beta-lactamase superfamily II)